MKILQDSSIKKVLSSECLDIIQTVHDGVYIVDTNRKIVFWNKEAERISGFNAEEVLGKSCKDNILMHVDGAGTNLCKSICPLAKTIIDGEKRKADVFLHNKQGHRVSVHVETSRLVHNGNVVGAVEYFRDTSSSITLNEQIQRLSEQSLLDHLTQLANRRYIDITLDDKLKELDRFSWPFSIALCDIDNFKIVNDTYGHLTGDDVLIVVAKSLTSALRSFDFVGRWGGEEFLVVLPGITLEEQLTSICQRMLRIVEASTTKSNGTTLSVTISCGATQAVAGDSIETLLCRADKGLYESKRNGKNMVTVISE